MINVEKKSKSHRPRTEMLYEWRMDPTGVEKNAKGCKVPRLNSGTSIISHTNLGKMLN